ncbi:MAG: hypothetical protein KDK61_05350, partial [Simkania sp.]|nr:hypothetical protein [Simkania sp.]
MGIGTDDFVPLKLFVAMFSTVSPFPSGQNLKKKKKKGVVMGDEKTIKKSPINKIVTEAGTQMRISFDEETVEE